MASSTDAGQKTARRASSGYARYVFAIMFAISFLNYLDRYVLIGAANVVAKELGFSLDGIGYITSAFLIIYTLGAVPLGIWADRSQRKNVVAICVAVWSVATALTALAGNFLALFLSRMILGIGEAGYFPAGTALMSDYFSREKRSRIMSWWSVAQYIGLLGGYVLGGALAGLYIGSWRLAFLFTGIPGLFLAFLMWRVREPRRNQADEEAAVLEPSPMSNISEIEESPHVAVTSNVLSQFFTLLRIKTLSVLIVMQVFAYFVLGVNSVFLPTYLQQKDTFNLTSGLAGLYSGGIIVLAGLVGTMLGGYMADMLNRRHPGARVLICGIGFLLGAPSFAMTMLFHDLTTFTIFFIVTVLLLTIYTGPSTAATQDVVPSILRASAPSIVGIIATQFDPTHGQHFLAGMAGHDLSIALLITCTPALVIAGLIGIFGSRWMGTDVAAAQRADLLTKEG